MNTLLFITMLSGFLIGCGACIAAIAGAIYFLGGEK